LTTLEAAAAFQASPGRAQEGGKPPPCRPALKWRVQAPDGSGRDFSRAGGGWGGGGGGWGGGGFGGGQASSVRDRREGTGKSEYTLYNKFNGRPNPGQAGGANAGPLFRCFETEPHRPSPTRAQHPGRGRYKPNNKRRGGPWPADDRGKLREGGAVRGAARPRRLALA